MMKNVIAMFLIIWVALSAPMALAQEQTSKADPHQIYRFREVPEIRSDGREVMMPLLPDDNYFWREFKLASEEEKLAAGAIYDRTQMPFAQVVRNDSQAGNKGYLPERWLQPGQCVGITMEEIGSVYWGADGNLYRVNIPANWPVVFDCRDGTEGPQHEVLAVFSCGNKVIDGRGQIKPVPVGEVTEVAERLETERLKQALVEATSEPDPVTPIEQRWETTNVFVKEDDSDFPFLPVLGGAALVGLVLALVFGGDDECPPGSLIDPHGDCKEPGQPNDFPSGSSVGLTIFW